MPNKSLGQHWLRDRDVLASIADLAEIGPDDTVLEIGPGLGTLTSELLRRAGRVVAVEFDGELARKLPAQFPGKNLEVINEDFLNFDLSRLPARYKVVANVPYYITGKIVNKLTVDKTTKNTPTIAVLLVQKEVAERMAAGAGNMSILAVSSQVFAEIKLGDIVPAELFTPPPKVDSQVIVLKKRSSPLVPDEDQRSFFRLVRAGFSEKRKKLRSSLAGGLGISKPDAEALLHNADISPDVRAEQLSVEDWLNILRKNLL